MEETHYSKIMECKIETGDNRRVLLNDDVKRLLQGQYFVHKDSYHVEFVQIVGFSSKKVRVVAMETEYTSHWNGGSKSRLLTQPKSGPGNETSGTVFLCWSNGDFYFYWHDQYYTQLKNPLEEFETVMY